MPLPPPFIPARRRVHRKRREAGSPAPVGALEVVSASLNLFDGDLIRVDVVFDTTESTPLASSAGASPGKWWARYDGQSFVGIVITPISFDTLRIELSLIEADPGADVISYSNAPSDIADTSGRQLAAFAGLPF